MDQLLPKLSAACYFITVCHSRHISDGIYFHSIMKNGIILWGNAPYRIYNFRIQKISQVEFLQVLGKEIPVEIYLKHQTSLPLQSQYILLLLRFVVMNMDQYKGNSDIHGKDTRQSSNLHQTTYKLLLYQTGTYDMGIKIFSSFYMQGLSHNSKQFMLF